MSNYISFKPQDAMLSSFIRFSITNRAYEDMGNFELDQIEEFKAFSLQKTLIFMKMNTGWYKVFTEVGSYLCKSSDDGFLITGFIENNLLDNNQAMKNGTLFTVTEGIIIQIKLKSYGIFEEIVHGREYTRNQYENVRVVSSVNRIVDQLEVTQEELEKDDPEVEISKKLQRLLNTAESYAILSNEKEEKEANELGKIPYIYIRPIEFNRIDRVAYEFGIQSVDEAIFKVGTLVEIEDQYQILHSAEITSFVKKDEDSPAKAMILLFNQHIDLDDFYQMGWFHLSFSTVNKDVQLAANEKIRNGEAQAKYMDRVLGQGASEGFEKKELSELVRTLSEEEYPPNESQMDAIIKGIESKDAFLVMGPPGTGKTTVILEWAKYFIQKEHKRVLISSQNNKAVDNVMTRLAKEDMDIIRIGSESKLQSEVIPYLFEHKVSNLRETIAKNSEEKIKTIKDILRLWIPYEKKAKTAEELILAMKKIHSELEFEVEQNLKPQYIKLNEIREDHENLQTSKRSVIEHMNKLHEKIIKHEEKEKGFLKMVTSIFYKHHLKVMKKQVRKYLQIKEQEKEILESYQNTKKHYDELYHEIKRNSFHLYDVQEEKIQGALSDLNEKPELVEGNIWGLFKEAYERSIETSSDGLRQKINVVEAMKRSEKLLSILSTWKEETVSKQNYALNEIVLESVDLVGATCIGINSQKRFADLEFDVTIIDEAGQIQIHNALVPMSVSNKLIMLGDHKQIPPMADPELISICQSNGVGTELLEKSLFEYMYDGLNKENKTMLDTQYRMPSEIADTISEYFYEGKYFSPRFKQNLRGQIPVLSEKSFILIDTSKERQRFDRKSDGGGYDNPIEAEIIQKLMKHLVKPGLFTNLN